jgi:uncharacterized membrane protein YoaK (UPF0700 family)
MFVALSAVAGFADAACFLALSKVFTAHVTGNVAALASVLVTSDDTTGCASRSSSRSPPSIQRASLLPSAVQRHREHVAR